MKHRPRPVEQDDLLRPRLTDMIDTRHELVKLAVWMPPGMLFAAQPSISHSRKSGFDDPWFQHHPGGRSVGVELLGHAKPLQRGGNAARVDVRGNKRDLAIHFCSPLGPRGLDCLHGITGGRPVALESALGQLQQKGLFGSDFSGAGAIPDRDDLP